MNYFCDRIVSPRLVAATSRLKNSFAAKRHVSGVQCAPVFSVVHWRLDATARDYPSRFPPPRHERDGFDSVTDQNAKVARQ
jgi:hypothetical protein